MQNKSSSKNIKKKNQLDIYKTISVIGIGSYSKVLLVKNKKTKKLFAMKVLKKTFLKKKKQEFHIKSEKKILIKTKNNPFIIKLHSSFQTKKKLYFILEYCKGGELFNHLQKKKRFSEKKTKFYTAQILFALDFLHKNKIIYKDLKPENILICQNGYIKITDFGLSLDQTDPPKDKSICGTPEYFAPELINRKNYGKEVDFWALGCLVYEMLVGVPPFFNDSRKILFTRIRYVKQRYPVFLSKEARSLIDCLLEKDWTRRLGSLNGVEDVKKHAFFRDLDWKGVLEKTIVPEFVPNLKNFGLNNFDNEFLEEPIKSFESSTRDFECSDFSNFSYQEDSNFSYQKDSNLNKKSLKDLLLWEKDK